MRPFFWVTFSFWILRTPVSAGAEVLAAEQAAGAKEKVT